MVYIREAHPEDGWQMRENIRDGVVFNSPKDQAERAALASQCARDLKLSFPFLMDDMRDSVGKAYAAWPDRIAVVDIDGRIAHYSGPGPGGFKPKPAETDLKRLLANRGRLPGSKPLASRPATQPAEPVEPKAAAPVARQRTGDGRPE